MKVNHWYTLKDIDGFCKRYGVEDINTEIANWLDFNIFMVSEVDEDGAVTKIKLTNGNEFTREEAFRLDGIDVCWFTEEEFKYFVEVIPPEVGTIKEQDKDYCVMSGNLGNYIMHTRDLTIEEAENYAKALSEDGEIAVLVLKGISKFNFVKEPRVEKLKF